MGSWDWGISREIRKNAKFDFTFQQKLVGERRTRTQKVGEYKGFNHNQQPKMNFTLTSPKKSTLLIFIKILF